MQHSVTVLFMKGVRGNSHAWLDSCPEDRRGEMKGGSTGSKTTEQRPKERESETRLLFDQAEDPSCRSPLSASTADSSSWLPQVWALNDEQLNVAVLMRPEDFVAIPGFIEVHATVPLVKFTPASLLGQYPRNLSGRAGDPRQQVRPWHRNLEPSFNRGLFIINRGDATDPAFGHPRHYLKEVIQLSQVHTGQRGIRTLEIRNGGVSGLGKNLATMPIFNLRTHDMTNEFKGFLFPNPPPSSQALPCATQRGFFI
ncbi:hypothetical protein B9Z19DRAFT_263738 [Tuber borchii]|uniref:Uncharacterized protein n=1 Tax=Tuber borchii TaxID=42251 RepID=A0A2T6ZL60_TUBBO|nr:hypothetical protein B9Z19DRAFT_263738 [Tuber borchii]